MFRHLWNKFAEVCNHVQESCKSCWDFGKGMSLIALTFSVSAEIPFSDIFCPKSVCLVSPKTRLSLFDFKPDFWILFKICSVWICNWFRIDPNIMILSSLFLAPSQSSIIPWCPVGKLQLQLHYVSHKSNT